MKVTKTTRLLAKPLIVSLTDIGVIDGITLAISADNPQGISGYEMVGDQHGFDAKLSINGGDSIAIHPSGTWGGGGFFCDLDGVKSGDEVRVIVELDPNKRGYEAGTMEKVTIAP